MAQDVAILDFGSSKITVLIGERGVNNTISISGMGVCDYAGFSDGEWFEPEQVSYVIGHAISIAETNSRTKIKHLYIGVPGEFTSSVCRDVSLSFSKKRKINEADVESIHTQGNIFESESDYILINSQPIYYTLDDERRLIEPVGLSSTKLGGHISYILAQKKFITFIDNIMNQLNIESVEYISSVLAETLFLFDEVKRDQFVILMDVGYITTNIIVARGDGILDQRYFSMGGGNITGDLAMALGISFSEAESLKRKVVLSLKAGEDDLYEIITREDKRTFKAKEVNEIVMDRISIIAKHMEKCLSLCAYDYPGYLPYHLTGGGLSYLRGARDFLSKQLGKPVEIIAPSLPQFNRPQLSSSLGLIDMVLNQQTPVKKKGFFAKLFGK